MDSSVFFLAVESTEKLIKSNFQRGDQLWELTLLIERSSRNSGVMNKGEGYNYQLAHLRKPDIAHFARHVSSYRQKSRISS